MRAIFKPKLVIKQVYPSIGLAIILSVDLETGNDVYLCSGACVALVLIVILTDDDKDLLNQ